MPVAVITVVSTVAVMAVSGRVTQAVINRSTKGTVRTMSEVLSGSAFFGVLISISAYGLGFLLKKNLNSLFLILFSFR